MPEGSTATGIPILDGQDFALQLGIEFRGKYPTRDITITNIGDADWKTFDITFTGTEFQLVSIPPTIIPVDGTEIIQVLVTGTNAGIFLETMVVSSDDTDEATFSFGVFAEIIGPDIWVGDGLDIFLILKLSMGKSLLWILALVRLRQRHCKAAHTD